MDAYIKRDHVMQALTYVGTAEPTDIIPLTLATARKSIMHLPTFELEQLAEIERLKAYNENLRTANAHVLGTLQDEIEKAKTETIKEFAKMLRAEMQNLARVECGDNIYFLVGEPLIDDIEQQMMEV